jgi:hypothetical protein
MFGSVKGVVKSLFTKEINMDRRKVLVIKSMGE